MRDLEVIKESDMLKIVLRAYRHGAVFLEKTFQQRIIKIGTLESSHFCLSGDDSVSRMHAVIEVSSGGDIYIIDLGSSVGTLVNEQMVNKCLLNSGDTITLGDTKISIETSPAPKEFETEESETVCLWHVKFVLKTNEQMEFVVMAQSPIDAQHNAIDFVKRSAVIIRVDVDRVANGIFVL